MISGEAKGPGEIIGQINRDRVREWLCSHPGGRQSECAKALGLSSMAVSRHVKQIRCNWSDRNIPPAAEGSGATRRHWVIVKEPGRIPEKKGPFRGDAIEPFLRELIAHHDASVDLTMISLTWDFDIWAECGRDHIAIADSLAGLSDEDWAEISGGRGA